MTTDLLALEPYRVAFTGARDFPVDMRRWFVDQTIDRISRNIPKPKDGKIKPVFFIIGDNPNGIDRYATDYAISIGMQLHRDYVVERAEWKKHGDKSAGPIRNAKMLDHYPHLLLAFPTRSSVGTWDMVMQAAASNKRKGFYQKCRIEIVYHPGFTV